MCRIMYNKYMKVAIVGRRKINKSQDLIDKLTKVFVELIENEGADTFLFGSQSQFDDLCYEIVTELRYKYTHIQRIWVRAEYRYCSEDYLRRVLTFYEDTIYPKRVYNAGRFAYIARNEVLVDMCDVLLTYLDSIYKRNTASGTKMTFDYAQKMRKRIINILDRQ